MSNLEIVKQAVEFAKRAGADQAEAMLGRSRNLSVEVTMGQVETIKQAEDLGIAVRAIVGNRMGLSYATDFDEASLRRVAERAVQVARASDADEFVGFAEPAPFPTVDGFDDDMPTHSPDEKIERSFAIERAAKEHDARIVMTRRVSYMERESNSAIANSRGLAAEQRNNFCGGMAMVIARDASGQEVGVGYDFKRRYAGFDAKGVGVEAAEQAVSLLGASLVPSQRASIVLEPKMAGAFLGIIANLVCANNIQKNKSLFAGKLGKQVAANGVTIIDDATSADAPGARAWDDEGVASRRTVVIADGVLQNYLHSTYTARRANTQSTGNAMRASIKVLPDPMPSNFAMVAGTVTPESLIAGVSRGLLVKNLMNLHTANPISGEFSFGANGLWIENGKVVNPVRGVTISGNLTDLLMNLRGIGNDLTWQGAMGMSVAAPTVLIEDVSIAGK